MPPRFRAYAGECGCPLNFVLTKNVRRRHLTESQRALVAARLKPFFEADARQRQAAALELGRPPRVGPNLGQPEKQGNPGRSAQQAAVLMRVSRTSVNAAERVTKQGVSLLVDALAAGNVSVSAAARIAGLAAEQQAVVLSRMESGFKLKQAVAQVTNTCTNDLAAPVEDAGLPLPEALIAVFRQRAQLQTLGQRMEALGREVLQLQNASIAAHLDVQAVWTGLTALRQTLWAA